MNSEIARWGFGDPERESGLEQKPRCSNIGRSASVLRLKCADQNINYRERPVITSLTALLTFLIVFSSFTSGNQAGAEEKVGRIEVTVAPVRTKDGGNLVLALYQNKNSWLKLDRATATKIVPVKSDTVFVVFEGVLPGQYALSVIHDKNENGKFDMRIFPFPKPKEGAGVSNNHRRKGKPKYEKALFTVGKENTSLQIELFY